MRSRKIDALIIAMEAHEPISKSADLKTRGIRLCLQKPISYRDLQSAIGDQLGLRYSPKLVLRARDSLGDEEYG